MNIRALLAASVVVWGVDGGRATAAPLIVMPFASELSSNSGTTFVEGASSSARTSVLTPPSADSDGMTRVFVQKQGDGRVFDVPGTCWLSYAQKSARYVVLGVGLKGTSVYIKSIEYIDEHSLSIAESQHGLARDSWVARTAVFSGDGEFIAFVGRRAAEPMKLWLLQTGTDALKAIGAAPSPIPADPSAYDPLPKDWSDESFDDVIQLADGVLSFPTDTTLRVVYGDPTRGKGRGARTWQLPSLFAR